MRNVYALLFDLTNDEMLTLKSKGIQGHIVHTGSAGKTSALKTVLDDLLVLVKGGGIHP